MKIEVWAFRSPFAFYNSPLTSKKCQPTHTNSLHCVIYSIDFNIILLAIHLDLNHPIKIWHKSHTMKMHASFLEVLAYSKDHYLFLKPDFEGKVWWVWFDLLIFRLRHLGWVRMWPSYHPLLSATLSLPSFLSNLSSLCMKLGVKVAHFNVLELQQHHLPESLLCCDCCSPKLLQLRRSAQIIWLLWLYPWVFQRIEDR